MAEATTARRTNPQEKAFLALIQGARPELIQLRLKEQFGIEFDPDNPGLVREIAVN